MQYLGIDIGSSYIKTALLDTDLGGILPLERRPAVPPLPSPDPRVFQLDAGQIKQRVRELVNGAAERFPGLRGVLLSTQMHGFVLRDGGEERYISWQDTRCLNPLDGERSYMEFLRQRLSAKRMERCGVYIKPSLGLCNLYAMAHQSCRPARGVLYTLGSYLIEELTGNNICHLSNAAPLGFVDVPAGAWDRELLEDLGLGGLTLPQITGADFLPCGTYRAPTGRELAVFPDYGDQQAAVLGCFADERDAVVNIATACQLARITDRFAPGGYETRPYFQGRYIQVVSNLPGGRNLNELIGFVGEAAALFGPRPPAGAVWEAVMAQVSGLDSGLSVDMRIYATPEQVAGGAVRNITPGSLGVNSLFSAAIRDLARNYRKAAQSVFGQDRPRRLVFSGGVSWRVPKLLELVAESFALPYTLSAFPDEALAGLYRAAMVCCGACVGPEEATRPPRTITEEELQNE